MVFVKESDYEIKRKGRERVPFFLIILLSASYRSLGSMQGFSSCLTEDDDGLLDVPFEELFDPEELFVELFELDVLFDADLDDADFEFDDFDAVDLLAEELDVDELGDLVLVPETVSLSLSSFSITSTVSPAAFSLLRSEEAVELDSEDVVALEELLSVSTTSATTTSSPSSGSLDVHPHAPSIPAPRQTVIAEAAILLRIFM